MTSIVGHRSQAVKTLESAALYIVATPIGNLEDITARAVKVLSEVDWIAAEDTRHTQKLLQALGIRQKRLISLHEHNESARAVALQQALEKGETGALVSDAGTPLINDPGYQLVCRLREAQMSVIPIPGPSAVITALCAAGLPTDRFSYEGFLPARSSKRVAALQALQEEVRTMVFYESPHRLLESLRDFAAVFADNRQLVVAKELTKQFEQFVSGSVDEVLKYFVEHPDRVRGEFVLMLAGKEKQVEVSAINDRLIQCLLAQGLPVKQISAIVADYDGQKKNAIYQRVLALKDQ